MPVHRAFKTNAVVLVFYSWATRVPCYVHKLLVTLDLNPVLSLTYSLAHLRVSNHDAEVFLAFLGHECLVEWLRLGGLRTRVLIVLVL